MQNGISKIPRQILKNDLKNNIHFKKKAYENNVVVNRFISFKWTNNKLNKKKK